MKSRLLHALLSSLTVAGLYLAAGAAASRVLPEGRWRQRAERYLSASGESLQDRLESSPRFRRLRKRAFKNWEAAQESLEDAQRAVESAARRRKLARLYTAGSWAAAGFLFCLLAALFFGLSSFKSALALGFKVFLALLFAQSALVFAGLFALQRARGG